FAGGAVTALAQVGPSLVGLDAASPAAVREAMDQALRGHAYAKSAVDVACHDLLGRIAGLSCSALLGGRRMERFPLYLAVPLGPPGEMAAFARAAGEAGIHRLQLKIGGLPVEDVARVRAVVEATGDEDVIIADANGAWRLQDATIALRLLEGIERVRIEQPCPTIEECVTLRRMFSVPMVLDEVVTDVASLLRCHAAGAMDAINLKISRVGGLGPARLIRELCEELGLRLTIEDTWGGDLTTAAVSHLAASVAPEAFYAASFMNDWTLEHVAGYLPRSAAGVGSAPDRPGLGVEVDESLLGEPLQRHV
ncbi:MAG TPA: mandelate racemase/muconate lactonizing enzyme family protein, partial [Acidimicrobiales bacterium]|nr:mandelate racemase/muconate lactonizing enzyme family protein [Acidimicrobiales bacterium]